MWLKPGYSLIIPCLIGFGIAVSSGKNISVITFKESDLKGVTDEIDISEELTSFERLGFCFRFMIVQFWRRFKPIHSPKFGMAIKNDQDLQLTFYLNKGQLDYKKINLNFCQPYIPGQWVSLCFSFKFANGSLDITGFQNGQLCFQKIVPVKFAGVHLKHKNFVTDTQVPNQRWLLRMYNNLIIMSSKQLE